MDAAFLPPTVLSGGIVEPLHHPCTVVKRQMRSPASVLHSNRVSMTVRTRTEEYGFSNPSFVDSVSGEWFGYECAFSVQGGEPRNIPVCANCYLLSHTLSVESSVSIPSFVTDPCRTKYFAFKLFLLYCCAGAVRSG